MTPQESVMELLWNIQVHYLFNMFDELWITRTSACADWLMDIYNEIVQILDKQ